jgi:hypothetical protein
MVTKHYQLLYNLSFSYLSFNFVLWFFFSIFLLYYDMLACFSALIFFLLFTIYIFIWFSKCDKSIITKYSRRFQSKTKFGYGILCKLRVLTFTEQNNNDHYFRKLHYQLLYKLSFSYLACNLLLWRFCVHFSSFFYCRFNNYCSRRLKSKTKFRYCILYKLRVLTLK